MTVTTKNNKLPLPLCPYSLPLKAQPETWARNTQEDV